MTYTNEMEKALTMYDGDNQYRVFETMFAHTQEDGTLYVPMFDRENLSRVTRVTMNWTEQDVYALERKFQHQFRNLRMLSRVINQYDGTDESIKNALNPAFPSVFDTWMTYVRPTDVPDFDEEYVSQIEMNMMLCDAREQLERERERGEEWSEKDRELYEMCRDVTVSPAEEEYVDGFYEALEQDAVRRIGEGIGALDVIVHARRLCRLWADKAPREVVSHEKVRLCQAMAIHRFASVYELCV